MSVTEGRAAVSVAFDEKSAVALIIVPLFIRSVFCPLAT